MKSKNFFNSLIASALKEEPPQVSVADSVITTLAAEDKRLEWLRDRYLMLVAAISSAVAAPAAVLAVILHNIWVGPLFEISRAISWVM